MCSVGKTYRRIFKSLRFNEIPKITIELPLISSKLTSPSPARFDCYISEWTLHLKYLLSSDSNNLVWWADRMIQGLIRISHHTPH
ncbi:hypothetical protein DID88_000231 [Monilinia fructigena]|uniref:Uncharacterized protein n=1 Tax=Monilinia fructigena TaxID=38457 RepID=A0A395IJT3_9HELO|nr:hypothetical protein DID88_000231 [Monilinia fructigena]